MTLTPQERAEQLAAFRQAQAPRTELYPQQLESDIRTTFSERPTSEPEPA